ncbi:hypothetical protein Cgig2_000597 [Carnegiea gigantea]|uniref:Aminotransferase-like plant mobile domain-containing protein n=1 Tax=Carnegiea gigantea TaxID=171969 RepID=A0A9Q1GK68_9CARY|nr:hypothetical protein Cgig2_000597 [Carnegiea gigantea]
MSRYVWAEAVWQYMVHSLDDMQRRLCNPISHIQFNGFSLLIQVWFYEHTIQFDAFEKRTFLWIASWSKVYYGSRYNAFELVAGITENEIIPVLHPPLEKMEEPIVRESTDTDDFRYYVEDEEAVLSFEERLRRVQDSLRKEKEAHASTRVKLELWKAHSTVADSSVHAHVGPQVTYDNKDGVHVSREMGSPGMTCCTWKGNIWELRYGSSAAKTDSAVETDVEEDVSVRTKGVTIPQAGEPGMADMETKVGVTDEAETSMPGAETIESGDSDVVRTSGVNEIAPVPEE